MCIPRGFSLGVHLGHPFPRGFSSGVCLGYPFLRGFLSEVGLASSWLMFCKDGLPVFELARRFFSPKLLRQAFRFSGPRRAEQHLIFATCLAVACGARGSFEECQGEMKSEDPFQNFKAKQNKRKKETKKEPCRASAAGKGWNLGAFGG